MDQSLDDQTHATMEVIQVLSVQIIKLATAIGRLDVADAYLEALHRLYGPLPSTD
jgi:hypothetical protein